MWILVFALRFLDICLALERMVGVLHEVQSTVVSVEGMVEMMMGL